MSCIGQVLLPDPLLEGNAIQSASTGFCSPGVLNKSRGKGLEIAYNINSGGILGRPDEEAPGFPNQVESFQSTIFKIKLPLVNKPGFKMMVGYDYIPESYNFSSINPSFRMLLGGLLDNELVSNGFGLYMIKPLNEKNYAALRFKYRLNGDYEGWINFDNRYAAYQASFIYGFKKSDDFEWGFGANFSHNFRRTIALPFVFYNRNFNKNWGVEALFPAKVYGRYNVDSENIFLFGYEFNSRNYSMDVHSNLSENPLVYHYAQNDLKFGISFERQMVPWVWLNMKAGYQFNFNTRFEATSPDAISYELATPSALYFRLGLFLSPPDKLCK